jgi:outer membrane protein assembly factor BamE (lipoprotein component of BamABCDE complex)
MEKKLLIDYFGIIKPVLTEDSNGQMVMRGEFGRADTPTENKRIYPRAIWEREIQRIQEAISEGKVLGELDHPSDGKTSLKRVSHVMTRLEMEPDGKIVGEARIMNNEHGRQLKSILDAGGAVGVSSRGMGSTSMNETGYEVVQEDYTYMTHDCVADPAVKSSYPTFSSVESKEIKKETVVMETKVENKETKPVVETVAPTVSPEVVVEAKQPIGKPIDQLAQEMKDRLDAQKKELEESHKKDLETKLSEAKLAFEKDPKAIAGRIVLEDVAKLLRPVLLPEDVQAAVKEKEAVIEAKNKEIADLKAKLTEESVKSNKYAKMAHDLGMLLHFEKTVAEGMDKEAVRKIIGDPKKFEKHQDLTEAVEGASSALKKVMEEKKASDKTEENLKTEYEKKLSEEKQKTVDVQKKLEEAVTLAKGIGIRAYVLERTKNNPNSSKILKLVEDVTTKAQADALIEKFSVEPSNSEEYNSIRSRFKKLETTTLVEEQLRETGIGKKPAASNVVVEGVEAEMAGLFPGASTEQVRDLSGL